MSEIKAADKCAIYNTDIITIRIVAVCTGFDSRNNPEFGLHGQFHRKQCRKLVKMKKCVYCHGDGQFIAGSCATDTEPQYVTCKKCNGKGRVRV